ncbi:MAG: XRE family transcriptional regulator, partial [[Eubacterium] rectale]|nr:XRE family transcriptional regulator [Agathobacter rectalis]
MVKDKQKAIFSENLNSYIAKSEKTQLEIAKSIGVSPQTFNTWCKGIAIPRMGKVQALADYFNINKSDLIEEKKLNIDTVPIESGYTIPVLGRVAAGYGKEAVEEVIGQIEISPAMASKGEFFGLLIKGDSMIPTLYDGDTVIVERTDDAESGDLVIALVNGSDATCKRLQKYAEGIALIPQNPVYEPMRFTESEIDTTPVKILGKVV